MKQEEEKSNEIVLRKFLNHLVPHLKKINVLLLNLKMNLVCDTKVNNPLNVKMQQRISELLTYLFVMPPLLYHDHITLFVRLW